MNPSTSSAILIADLGYGDAGKGSLVDALTRTTGAQTVVRYNGGAQAAHNVVAPDGRHHTFAQFGSGTFLPGVRTHLSRFMLVHPLAMLAEERHLQTLGVTDAFARTTIERGALITTPFHQAANRLKEMSRGDGRHGSCGLGIGETMSDWLDCGSAVLFAGDLEDRDRLLQKLVFLRDLKLAQLEGLLADLPRTEAVCRELELFSDPGLIPALADVYEHFAAQVELVEPGFLGTLLNQPGMTLFEGAQGVLLDEWWGFYPYNTWSTLTYQNAETLLSENGFAGEVLKLGLIRAYATRHGAGPFVTEDAALTASVPEPHNGNNDWQRQFRVGPLDLVALRYALQVTGPVDGLVVSHLDRLAEIPDWRICEAYQYPGAHPRLDEFFEVQGAQIHGIKVPPNPADLIQQERLTRLLLEMQPVYTDCRKDPNEYLALVSQKLNLPVAITSSGPTAEGKSYFTGRLR
jgi:adenylosuccinate synthase